MNIQFPTAFIRSLIHLGTSAEGFGSYEEFRGIDYSGALALLYRHCIALLFAGVILCSQPLYFVEQALRSVVQALDCMDSMEPIDSRWNPWIASIYRHGSTGIVFC